MIERGILMAFQRSRALVDKAFAEKRLDDAMLHISQSNAIIRLEQKRRELFTQGGIEDIPLLPELPLSESRPPYTPPDERLDEMKGKARNMLLRHGVRSLEAVASLSDEDILKWPNVGQKTLVEIRRVQAIYIKAPQEK